MLGGKRCESLGRMRRIANITGDDILISLADILDYQ